jgi:hypothetical protein
VRSTTSYLLASGTGRAGEPKSPAAISHAASGWQLAARRAAAARGATASFSRQWQEAATGQWWAV